MGEWRTNRKLTRAADLPALIHCESVGFRKDDGAFHHVLQLADIAGPIVGSEERQRVLIAIRRIFLPVPLANRATKYSMIGGGLLDASKLSARSLELVLRNAVSEVRI